MSQPIPPSSFPANAVAIGQAHQLYCQLTGQSLGLGFDRERMWYELLRLGYSLQDLRTVILYLHLVQVFADKDETIRAEC